MPESPFQVGDKVMVAAYPDDEIYRADKILGRLGVVREVDDDLLSYGILVEFIDGAIPTEESFNPEELKKVRLEMVWEDLSFVRDDNVE